jgi:adenylosuccinate lyase
VIARYTRPEIGALWTDAARMEAWRRVEVAACEVMEGPGDADLAAIRAATFTVEAVQEREAITDHDVAAFVDVLSASAGEAGRWIHFGLTSSDVLDTALALQIQAAGEIVLRGARELEQALAERAREHVATVCVGRTHGVHAEPTTFGVKLAGFAMEARRNVGRLERAFAQASVGAVSGAVGTYAAVDPSVEEYVCGQLGLAPAEASTQVVQRDRHAEFLSAVAITGATLEKMGLEIRHLQRTEVREVQEPFAEGQRGSSAMPHKRNPILSERICGLARLLRANLQAGLENVALWHERDISHSSVERVILPDSSILLDYMLHLATTVLEGLRVFPERMRENLEASGGLAFSQPVLLALVDRGLSREVAYEVVQSAAAAAWDRGADFRAELLADDRVRGVLAEDELTALFQPRLEHLDAVFFRLEKLELGTGGQG